MKHKKTCQIKERIPAAWHPVSVSRQLTRIKQECETLNFYFNVFHEHLCFLSFLFVFLCFFCYDVKTFDAFKIKKSSLAEASKVELYSTLCEAFCRLLLLYGAGRQPVSWSVGCVRQQGFSETGNEIKSSKTTQTMKGTEAGQSSREPMTSLRYLLLSHLQDSMTSWGVGRGGAFTHSVVEGMLCAGHAAVVAAVRWRGDHAPRRWVERPGEGCRGRARRRHLTVDWCGAGLSFLQGQGWVRDSAHVHLLTGSANICGGISNWWCHQITPRSWEQQEVQSAIHWAVFSAVLSSTRTCNDFTEFGVQVDGARQEGANVPRCKDRCPWWQEDLEAAHVSVDLQQRLHVLCGWDVLRHS